MPKIQIQTTESEGWKPLPKGTYDWMIDSAQQTMSSNNNPQLKLAIHLLNHPQYGEKKGAMFLPMVPSASFRLVELLDATGVDSEEIEIPKGSQQDDKGNDLKSTISFDTDDLVGATFRSDCDIQEYNGKDQQRYNNLRPIEATPRPQGVQPQAQPQTAPANGGTQAQPQGQPAPQQTQVPGTEQPMQRRRRVVQA